MQTFQHLWRALHASCVAASGHSFDAARRVR